MLLGCPSEIIVPDPGEYVMHRLNRAEYNNTVRDLLGTSLTPADDFPTDDHGYGFDNIGAALSMSPLHVELYERAADLLVTEALSDPEPWPLTITQQAEEAGASVGSDWGLGFWNLSEEGEVSAVFDLVGEGTWTVRTRAFGHPAAGESARFSLRVDGNEIGQFDAPDLASEVQVFEVDATLLAGFHIVSVAFLNDFWQPEVGADRNLLIDWIEVEGPIGRQTPPNAIKADLLTCDPELIGRSTCTRAILGSFATRAWRRPLTGVELDSLLALAEAAWNVGESWEYGLGLALKAALVSPHFLFRVELDEYPASTEPHRVNDYELASRLSYFLWSSMPDEDLFALAHDGTLHLPEVLAGQVRRMLADPQSDALIDNFAGQWLFIRAIEDAAPDGATWPDFDDDVRASLQAEMRLFFAGFLDGRDMRQLLTSTSTWLDSRLVGHYELDLPEGIVPADGTFVEVDFPDGPRGGLLGMGGLMTATSYPLRTSPTLRGKWVLGHLLCAEPPAPPPGVEGLSTEDETDAETLRERLEQHREDPVCASCHEVMDEIGFALEPFDPVGVHRTEYSEGVPVDASGTFPDGRSFVGPRELTAVIAADERLGGCIARQLYTYALGRGPVFEDLDPMVDIEAAFMDSGYSFEELAIAIVTSDPFLLRRGQP